MVLNAKVYTYQFRVFRLPNEYVAANFGSDMDRFRIMRTWYLVPYFLRANTVHRLFQWFTINRGMVCSCKLWPIVLSQFQVVNITSHAVSKDKLKPFDRCFRVFVITQICQVFTVAIVETAMAMRVWALYHQSKRIFFFLAVLVLATTVHGMVINTLSLVVGTFLKKLFFLWKAWTLCPDRMESEEKDPRSLVFLTTFSQPSVKENTPIR